MGETTEGGSEGEEEAVDDNVCGVWIFLQLSGAGGCDAVNNIRISGTSRASSSSSHH